jgi:hypothetical protein
MSRSGRSYEKTIPPLYAYLNHIDRWKRLMASSTLADTMRECRGEGLSGHSDSLSTTSTGSKGAIFQADIFEPHALMAERADITLVGSRV